MKGIRPKQPRLRLDPQAYNRLREAVLERDGWRCQLCGRRRDLHVHHIKPRSKLGDDCASNLIVVCARCHSSLHEGKELAYPGRLS